VIKREIKEEEEEGERERERERVNKKRKVVKLREKVRKRCINT
jgi:hypothetical protein